MTDFITGKACADVTGRLYDRIMQTVRDGGQAVIIVPDQFVFETEKALFRKCAACGRTDLFQQIKVRTIARISDEIVTKYSSEKPPADDITKSVIMYRAVRSRGVELSSLGRISRKPGFAPRMVKTVSLFKTAGIDCAKLGTRLEEEQPPVDSPALLAKLKDISALYTEYDQMLSANFTDKLDITMRAADLASRHPYFSGMNIFVDGFNSFSGSQLMLLRTAADRAQYACFAFVCDKNDRRDIFHTILADIDALSGGNGIPEPACDNTRGMAEGLIAASDRIYSGEPDPAADMSALRIIRADDVYCEMDFIAAEIKRLVSEVGLRYSEIAVLCADPADYRTPAESAFAKYDIPMFCDIPEVILNAPLTNLILSLLRSLDEPTVENLTSYVRSSFLRVKDEESGGFRALSFADIDSFDGYIFRWQLRGSQLEQEFSSAAMNPEDKAQAERAENVRTLAAVPVLELRREIMERSRKHECTGAWLSERVCGFLFEKAGIEQAVLSAEESCSAMWDILVSIFQAMHSALSSEEISPGDYYALFRDICAEAELAKPPQLTDCVIVGDTGRTRADGIRAVFIAGACYGVFPEEGASCGLFSEYEAELLGESDIKIAMKQEEMYHYNRYQAYRAMTLAADRLYLTYPLMNTACSPLSRSEIITDLLELFPQLSEEYAGDAEKFGDGFYCRTKYALRSRYASMFGSKELDRRSTLRKALELSGDGEYASGLDRLVEERPAAYRHRLAPDTARKLFRANRVSATKLEGLNKCRFEYFCRFGLKIRERRTLNAANSDVGTAVHYVLEKTLSEYCTKMNAFFRLDRNQLIEHSAALLEEFAGHSLGGAESRSRSFSYMYSGLAVSCADLLSLLQKEFSSREYRPVLFELEFRDGAVAPIPEINRDEDTQMTLDDLQERSEPLPLETKSLSVPPLRIRVNDKVTVAITGIVDRADMFRSEGGNEYIRIVDYKTGGHAFKMSNALYGVNTQMLVYLIALCDANPGVTPGGVSYLTAKMTDASSTPSGLMALLAKGHYPSGMCVTDDQTRAEMEQFAERYAKAILLPGDDISTKKLNPKEDAQPTPAQFQKLREEILSQTESVLRRLYSGDVQAVPTIYTEEGKAGQQKSCTYCRYKSICGNQDKHGVIVDEGITERKLGAVGAKAEKPAEDGKKPPRTRKKKTETAKDSEDSGFIGSLT